MTRYRVTVIDSVPSNAIEQVVRMSAAIRGDKLQPRISLRSSGLRLLVEIGFLHGTKGANCYGPDPLSAA